MDDDSIFLEEGEEWVFIHTQMLKDVYYYEGDAMPSFEDFKYGWLTRPNDQEFWVYRQGTPVYSFYVNGEMRLFAIKAKTADLDKCERTGEGYHHVPTISWNGASVVDISRSYTYRETDAVIKEYYDSIVAEIKEDYS
jgi:hypothetical protein